MTYRIGEISRKLGLRPDTLRYYEKIGLLRRIARAPSGLRLYDDSDASRLRFICRAQNMNFSLAEIGDLLQMRDDPRTVRDDVRTLMELKLEEVEERLRELTGLRTEMRLLVNLCRSATDGCPILENIARPG